METFYYLEKALLSLNINELRLFEKFLHSPYFANIHANNISIQKLYKLIKPNLTFPGKFKKFNLDSAIKKVISAKVKISKNYPSKIKSELLGYLLEFFAFQSFRSDKINQKISTLNELDKRGLVELFEHHCNSKYFYKYLRSYNEPEISYYYYKIYQIGNRHREKTRATIDKTDYLIELNLLKNYFKKEVECFQILDEFNKTFVSKVYDY